MKRCLFSAVLALLVWAASAFGQFGSFGDVPVSITADGATRFEAGVAIAEDNVQIHYGDYSIYCDYAEYNPDTRDVLLIGNIRLYTPREVLTGQRALFNLETKQMRALEFSGAHFPAPLSRLQPARPFIARIPRPGCHLHNPRQLKARFSRSLEKRANLPG